MKAFYGIFFVLNATFAAVNLYAGVEGHLFNLIVGPINALGAAFCVYALATEPS